MPNNGTASLLEILAAVANMLGIITAGMMMTATRRRHAASNAEARRRGMAISRLPMLAAWRHYRCEAGRIFWHLGSLVLGIWAMTLPSAETAYGYSAMSFRLASGVLFFGLSVFDLVGDRDMWRMISREDRQRIGRWGHFHR